MSAMSSMRMAVLPLTSPVRVMREISLGRVRSLLWVDQRRWVENRDGKTDWITAKGRSRRPAMDVALCLLAWPASTSLASRLCKKTAYLFTPPASGDTMTA